MSAAQLFWSRTALDASSSAFFWSLESLCRRSLLKHASNAAFSTAHCDRSKAYAAVSWDFHRVDAGRCSLSTSPNSAIRHRSRMDLGRLWLRQ